MAKRAKTKTGRTTIELSARGRARVVRLAEDEVRLEHASPTLSEALEIALRDACIARGLEPRADVEPIGGAS